jgi:hypothetical protein
MTHGHENTANLGVKVVNYGVLGTGGIFTSYVISVLEFFRKFQMELTGLLEVQAKMICRKIKKNLH